MDLVEQLRVALDEHEQIARAADPGPWAVGTLSTNVDRDGREGVTGEGVTVVHGEVWPRPVTVRGSHVCSKPVSGNGRVIADMARGYLRSRHEANADHIVANDPALVLRTIEAHRKIVELHGRAHECSQYDDHGEVDSCTWVVEGEACSTLQALASIYLPDAT